MVDWLILTLLILPCFGSQDAIVEYTDGGAYLTGTGYVDLNNPDPMTFLIEDFSKCTGRMTICYKSPEARLGNRICNPAYQQIDAIAYRNKAIMGFSFAEEGPNVRYTFAKESRFALKPDLSDGLFHFQILQLPEGCRIKVLGATDPNPKSTDADSLRTAKIVIYVLAGLAGLVLMIAILSVIYCLCLRQ
uniref:Ephrin RBD domain-containing protein n=1 Tax=Panagrellus redivivus TaxID=6233 RepID=A0A7E4W8M6_PANRE